MTKIRNMTYAAPDRREKKGPSAAAFFITVVLAAAAVSGWSLLSSVAGDEPLSRVARRLADDAPAIRLGEWPSRPARGDGDARSKSRLGR